MKKQMISTILALCALLLLIPGWKTAAHASSDEPIIRVGNAIAYSGEEFSVPVMIENNPGIMALTLGLDYDRTKLTFRGYSEGELNDWTMGKKAVWAGHENTFVNGTILNFEFCTLDGIVDGETYISVQCESDAAFNEQETAVPLSVEAGRVRIIPVDFITKTAEINREYAVLTPGEKMDLSVATDPEYIQEAVHWYLEDSEGNVANDGEVASIDQFGKVTASAPGTVYAVCVVPVSIHDSRLIRCRIDVLDEEQQANVEITANLPVTQISAEVYRTDYPRFDVVLGMVQNLKTADVTASNDTELKDTGIFIKEASFVGSNDVKKDIRSCFALHVVDDRTLEIVPIVDLSIPDAVKGMASSYQSAIQLILSDNEVVTTQELMTVKVGKATPKLTAKPVKLNSFVAGHTVPVEISGGTVSSITPIDLGFATLNADMTVTVKDNVTKNGKTTVNVTCQPDGWSIPATIKLSVSNTIKAPKLTFQPATVTLNQDIMDTGRTSFSITSIPGAKHSITGFKVYEKNEEVFEKLTVQHLPYGNIINVYLNSVDGQNHTYKVFPLIDGHEVSSFTVNVQKKGTTPSISAKASGTIDTEIDQSPITLTVTGKNCNIQTGYLSIKIKQMYGNTVTMENALDEGLFFVNQMTNGSTATFAITGSDLLKEYVEGYSYLAIVEAYFGMPSPVRANDVKLAVKTSTNPPARSMTLKATGSIDVLRPSTQIELKPTYKNWYNANLWDAKLYVNGEEIEQTPFECYQMYDRLLVRLKYGENIDPKQSFQLTMRLEDYTTKPVKLPVKMGTAKIVQSTKTVTLSKSDCFDRKSVFLSLDDQTMYDIRLARIEFVDKSNNLTLTELGNGEYAIGYANNVLPKGIDKMKTSNVKINVFLQGNNSSKPNASISVAVKFA